MDKLDAIKLNIRQWHLRNSFVCHIPATILTDHCDSHHFCKWILLIIAPDTNPII